MENSNPSLYNFVILIGIKYSYFSEAGSDDNFKTFPVEFGFWTIFFPHKNLQEEMVYGSTYTVYWNHFVSERKMTNKFSRLHQWLRNLVYQIVYFRKLMNYKVSWMNMFRKVRVHLKHRLVLFWSKRKNCFVTFCRSPHFQLHRLVVDTVSFNKVKLYKCLTKWFFQLFSRLISFLDMLKKSWSKKWGWQLLSLPAFTNFIVLKISEASLKCTIVKHP